MDRTVSVDGVKIAFSDRGPRSDEAVLCLPGWCVKRGFFTPLAEALASKRRVVVLDWPGHGDSGRPAGDFGDADLAAAALAVIEAARLRRVAAVAQSHGGWVAIELRRRLGERVPKIVATSWLVLDPPPPFAGALAALQDEARWEGARDQLFALWLAGAPAPVASAIRAEMGAFPFDVWSRAGREIAAEYARHRNPLAALGALTPPPPFLHLYSQPRLPEFLAAQAGFAREHPWFAVHRLDEAVSHFPPLEVPGATASCIEAFLDGRGAS